MIELFGHLGRAVERIERRLDTGFVTIDEFADLVEARQAAACLPAFQA